VGSALVVAEKVLASTESAMGCPLIPHASVDIVPVLWAVFAQGVLVVSALPELTAAAVEQNPMQLFRGVGASHNASWF